MSALSVATTSSSVEHRYLAASVGRISSPPPAATVFVVDDDVSVRESLEVLIRCEGWQPDSCSSAEEFLARLRAMAPSRPTHRVGANESAEECLANQRSTVPCCLILDLTLPGLSGLDLQKQLAGHLNMPVIFVSGQTDVATTVRAMKAGAFEFLTKPLRTDLLVDAMHDAIDRSREALRLQSEMRALRDCYESLTPREREVMRLVVSGLLNKQVGFELGISETTVKAHRGQVMRKMQAESLPDLVMMAARLKVRPGAKH